MTNTSRTMGLDKLSSEKPVFVSICICTYKRPQLKDCLESIAAQELPSNYSLRFVVVDNCEQQTAEPTVNNFRKTHEFDVKYLSCPIKNLSRVRNEALSAADGQYVAMLDDDEVVSEHWLISLIGCSKVHDADIVIGPVYNQYSDSCPVWLEKPDLMARADPQTGKQMQTGHAGNALLRTSALSGIKDMFDERLGRSGGEDTDFFYRLHLAGAKIIACREAPAREVIDPNRENMGYLVQENKRIGQVFCRVFWPKLSLPQRVLALAIVSMKLTVFGVGFLLTVLFGKRFSSYWKLRYTCNIEKIRYLIHSDKTIFRYCI